MSESIWVMLVSLVITIALVIFLNYVAKKTNNMVIKADALHYKTDVYTNGAVLISLVLIYFTGYDIIDAVIGGAISIYIIYSAYELIEEGVMVLLDHAVEEEKTNKIIEIIQNEPRVNDYHMLKTRQAGNDIFVDVHLVFDCIISLMDAHRITDKIEEKIKQIDEQSNWIITVHMDPYDDLLMNEEPNYIKMDDVK
jgi:cation diffusion facilitator family transporter